MIEYGVENSSEKQCLQAAGASEIEAAARLLEQGRLVAFPTETVYGLGADAENPQAVAAIYQAKGRPSDHPVIVHLAPQADPGYWVQSMPPIAQALMEKFWPGPLTLILPRAVHIPDAVSGGQSTVGLRCPSHPVAQQLLRAFKQGRGGVAAPSANKFGQVSPTTAQHVRQEFTDAQGNLSPLIAAILDGGQSMVGIESTILDLSRMDSLGAVLLRPGHICVEQLAEVLGSLPRAPDAQAPRASGTLAAHYAPRTPLALVEPGVLAQTVDALKQAGRSFALLHHGSHAFSVDARGGVHLQERAEAYAHGLYAALRRLDKVGAEIILVENTPQSHAWQGVNDRLRRAAHDSQGRLASLLQNKKGSANK